MVTFANRIAIKGLLGQPVRRERHQLRALLSVRRDAGDR
jgi:hypothetical protein